ncbi:MAG: hypothetical protein M0Z66_00995 [Thermaerobacter sp.]|nr:hypothetical protein [Thermaerobacter sp.]
MDRQGIDPVAHMAELVRARPTISGREIAASCGFAEPKSLYYHLRKHGYRGLNHFKEIVLRPADRTLPLAEDPAVYAGGGEAAWPPADVAFAYRWLSLDALPLVAPGDLLVGNALTPWREGDLLLYREAGRLRLAHFYLSDGAPRHAPLGREPGLREGEPRDLIGRITGILRTLVP